MNCSENTRTATQRAKQNLWFRRMFSVALLIGVLIGFLFAKVPIWFSTPEPTTTAVLYGAYTGQAVKVQSDGTIVQAGDFTPLNVPMLSGIMRNFKGLPEPSNRSLKTHGRRWMIF